MGGDGHPLLGYYRLHAHIYDATRWSFLFGRSRLIQLAATAFGAEGRGGDLAIVEVGCGTGRNLPALARAFPTARLTGVDLCAPMLHRAKRAAAVAPSRIRLVQAAYDRAVLKEATADLIVFSYALSMFNPGYEAALDAARRHLRPGGMLAVADFRSSAVPWFRSWMRVNHVRLDGHLPPALAARFTVVHEETRPAYGGLWRYFCCLGRPG
jgi:S-adenosylmethionine-diacylgycerolhomoserine-N-methlytransferase